MKSSRAPEPPETEQEPPPGMVRVLRRALAEGCYVLHGFAADLRTARLAHPCAVCRREIAPGERYYAIVGCGGLGALKFPARVHQDELGDYWRTLEERYKSTMEVENVQLNGHHRKG